VRVEPRTSCPSWAPKTTGLWIELGSDKSRGFPGVSCRQQLDEVLKLWKNVHEKRNAEQSPATTSTTGRMTKVEERILVGVGITSRRRGTTDWVGPQPPAFATRPPKYHGPTEEWCGRQSCPASEWSQWKPWVRLSCTSSGSEVWW